MKPNEEKNGRSNNGERKGGIKCNRQVPTTSHKLVCVHSNLSADDLESNI